MDLAWHTQKNQLKDVKGKEMEQDRKGKLKNEDIDLERTHKNIELVDSPLNLYQRVKQRVDELKASGSRVQKNSVVMYSNIFTVPSEYAEVFGEEKTDAYFKACYAFFCEEFGEENVVSAKIHKDETTPHMHLHFLPVNKANGRLQARVAMNKEKINYIHDELPKFLCVRGFDVQRGSGKTKGKNIEDIHEYKEIQQKITALATDYTAHQKQLQRKQKELQQLAQLHAQQQEEYEKQDLAFQSKLQLQEELDRELQQLAQLCAQQQEEYETYKQNLQTSIQQKKEEAQKKIQAQYEAATSELKQLDEQISLKKKIAKDVQTTPFKIDAEEEVKTYKEKVSLLQTREITEKTGNVIIAKEDFEKLKSSAAGAFFIKKDYQRLLTIEPVAENKKLTQHNTQLQQKNEQLSTETHTLQEKNQQLQTEVYDLRSTVKSLQREVQVIFDRTRQFLKESTKTPDAFRQAFHDFTSKISEKMPNSIFKQLHNRQNKQHSQQHERER